MIKIIIGVVIATIIGLVVLGAVESGQADSGGLLADGLVVEDGETVQVSIAGEVNREGTYLIDSGSTLGDLILAAGSATGNADPSAYAYAHAGSHAYAHTGGSAISLLD